MRRPLESAITRRDDHLARTRRLSLWIAGGAAAASVSLATAFGFALPGHAVTSGGQAPARHAGHSTGQTRPGHRRSGGSNHQLAPPQQPPSGSAAPPVVSSGGS
jgi:hypothetical protein